MSKWKLDRFNNKYNQIGFNPIFLFVIIKVGDNMKKKITIILTVLVITGLAIGSIILVTKYNKKINKTPNTTTTTAQNVVDDFDFKLLKEVNKDTKENYLISPYSINVALAMLRDGANNNTKAEIDKIIGTNNPTKINNPNIKISNAMFIKNMYKQYIRKEYTDGLLKNYNADFLFDDFASPAVINSWVSEKTDKMIDKLLDNIDPNFVLGLANAVAIDVEWKQQFECDATREDNFTDVDGNVKKVEMMNSTYKIDATYIESDKAKGIIIPYKDETDLEYVAILPNEDLYKYINSFDKEELTKLESKKKEASKDTNINLSLPRYGYSYSLDRFTGILNSLGMKEAFDSTKADLSNLMTKDDMNKSGAGNLYVSQAVHKTYIDLNEKGTKAAAVTFFGVSGNAMEPKQPEIINIKFDKPFMYMIREKKTNTILFVGTVYTPNEWKGTTCKKEE